jgi:hypothetical protein
MAANRCWILDECDAKKTVSLLKDRRLRPDS